MLKWENPQYFFTPVQYKRSFKMAAMKFVHKPRAYKQYRNAVLYDTV